MSTEDLSVKSVYQLKAEIRELENIAKELRKSIKDREDAIVELVAQFTVGDRVVVADYKGKDLVYEITKRQIGLSFRPVRYWGNLVKKNGDLGKVEVELSYHELRKA